MTAPIIVMRFSTKAGIETERRKAEATTIPSLTEQSVKSFAHEGSPPLKTIFALGKAIAKRIKAPMVVKNIKTKARIRRFVFWVRKEAASTKQ